MIKFLDLKNINESYETQCHDAFQRILNSGQYILGNEVDLFENEYAAYCGTKFCIGISNGLDALYLIFEGYKILGKLQEKDEVIVPANTYIATVLAISNAGLKPIMVEPEISTFNINPNEVLKYISSKTKAVLGVHLYGQLYNVSELESICKSNDLLLIEDAAQAHGAKFIDGRKAGNVSNAAAFSFYPTKNLGALGDAGAITTNDDDLAQVLYKIRNYGRKSTYQNDYQGYNCRLDELQAAILRIKLKYLDSDNEKRKIIAKQYLSLIDNKSIFLPKESYIDNHVFHLFVIRSTDRNRLKSYLFKNGVETFVHYPKPIYSQEAYKEEFETLDLPITDKLHREILSVPLNLSLTTTDIERISNLLTDFK